MDTTTHATTKLEEIWEQIGKKLWDELPALLRPRYGEIHIHLIIHDGQVVRTRGQPVCDVRSEKKAE